LGLKKNITTVLLLLWISFIAVISLVSFSKISQTKIENGDKYVHFVLYFVLIILLFFSNIWSANFTKKIKLLICFLISVSFGIIIEVMQKEFTVNRQFEWGDVFANTLGSFIALLFLYKFSNKNFFYK
jgi:VanZ family protein